MNDQNTNSNGAAAASSTTLPDENASRGTPFAKVATAQIAIARADLEKFGIDENFAKTNPALVDLILKTESMKDEERKYWFQLLPTMSAEQIKKLQNILQNERDQLTELDTKYAHEIAELDKNAASWSPENARKKRVAVAAAEKKNESAEKNAEADILSQLENM